ncbi:MAG: metX, partial [Methylocystaceae bacterium]
MSVLSEARPACSEGFAPKTVVFPPDRPLLTDGGGRIAPLAVAYETRGTLNAARSNAILLCHALTGDQYAAGVNPVTGKPGWWEAMVG